MVSKMGSKMRFFLIVVFILFVQINFGCEKETPKIYSELLDAVPSGNVEEVKKLLNKGADVNTRDENGITALMLASADGYKDIVDLLITKGADIDAVNMNGETALEITSYAEIRALLRQHDRNIHPTEFLEASRIGDLPAVKSYISRGVDINVTDNEGMTALIDASEEGRKDVVALLLATGAEVNAQTRYGLTALMGASLYGHREIVTLLLANGADINTKNKYGETALSIASDHGYKDLVETLLQKGAVTK